MSAVRGCEEDCEEREESRWCLRQAHRESAEQRIRGMRLEICNARSSWSSVFPNTFSAQVALIRRQVQSSPKSDSENKHAQVGNAQRLEVCESEECKTQVSIRCEVMMHPNHPTTFWPATEYSTANT